MATGGGFNCDPLDLKPGMAVFRVSGEGAYEAFRREAGGIRFQRIPPTERKGRVHSSTVTVAVLTEPAGQDLEINPRDLKFETYIASGPGGQHRNKSDTAVRVTHLPTGTQACSEHKSQSRNKTLALGVLKARLSQVQATTQHRKRNSKRKDQVGTGMRSDKIRTFAEQRGRVEDHRNGKRIKIRDFENGEIDRLH